MFAPNAPSHFASGLYLREQNRVTYEEFRTVPPNVSTFVERVVRNYT
jgi:hypothetical protein